MPEPALDREDPAYRDFIYFCSGLAQSDGIIVNTFEELEPISIKAIADGLCLVDAPTPPTYYIGPLIAAGSKAEHESLSWLEKQPSKSVVYLCFGSRGSFSRVQIMEIAKGLERSGRRFLWVEDGFVSGTELEKRVIELMDSDIGMELRERSWEMREKALAARGPSGFPVPMSAKVLTTKPAISSNLLCPNEREFILLSNKYIVGFDSFRTKYNAESQHCLPAACDNFDKVPFVLYIQSNSRRVP
ncbi:hypothetical protein QQP08_023455 [Theobroma cacao]|nr:hypothetical protein QQP08_023455 [Theobroma cacao]